jgi:GR25 family glycosyltransferase involved in LPS biosynthesis
MNKKFKTYIVHFKLLEDRKKNLEIVLNNEDFDYKFITQYDRRSLQTEVLHKFKNVENKFIANFMSHIEIYKIISESKDDYGLILEDDSIPDEKFNNNVYDYLNKLPQEFDLFYISPGKGNFHIPYLKRRPFKKVYKKENEITSWGGHGASRYADAYFISKKCASLLYDEFISYNDKIDTTIDWWKNQMIGKLKLNVYWAEPTIIKTNVYETSF